MLDRIARIVIAAPKRIIGVAFVVMAVAGVLGAPVSTMLSAGGFTDPDAESNRANAILIDEFGQGFVPLYLLVKAPDAVTDPVPLADAVESTALVDATLVITSADIPQESAPLGWVTVIVSPEAIADVTWALKTTTR